MYAIIIGTNRANSNTSKVAQYYADLLTEKKESFSLINLQGVDPLNKNEAFIQAEKQMIEANKLIFILPEYNGSVPGILKLVIDSVDIRKAFYGKKAMLTGVANGRAGNLRGLDHLTNMLNYLKMNVWYNKIPISSIDGYIKDSVFAPGAMEAVINEQVEGFLGF
jgi:chromate reductase, NAD(P)H dehydrogenase (quinone)